MRVLFVTPPAKAHLFAQVPLAWALRGAGHEVLVASRPNFVDEIVRTGLAAAPVGATFDPTGFVKESAADARTDEADNPHPWRSWEGVLDIAEQRPERLTPEYMYGVQAAWALVFQGVSSPSMVVDLVDLARSWRPDLILWDPLVFAGPVAARVCGASHARLLSGLDLIGGLRQRYRGVLGELPPEQRDDPLAEWLTAVLADHGAEFDEEILVGQWTVDPVPTAMRLPVDHHYVPVRHVPYNGQAALPGWLREPPRRRRVCLTLGLSFREVLGGDRISVAELLEAVADLDIEVVATLDEKQLAGTGELPPNVHAVDFVPLNELLPSCRAIVHQGGFGTLQTAFAHGVPQVILPVATSWDSLVWSRKVEERGAGLCVTDPIGLTVQRLRELLLRVLDEPSFADAAERLRTEVVGTPAPAEVVPLLERMVAAHRRSRAGRVVGP